MVKKNYQKQMRELRTSMASEIEELTTNFSRASRELIVMTHKYEEKSKYLGMYYEKSER